MRGAENRPGGRLACRRHRSRAPFLFPKGGKGKNPVFAGEQNGIGRVAQNRDQNENTHYPQAVEKHFVMFINVLIFMKYFSILQPVDIL